MSTSTNTRETDGPEWLFEKAREFPLLTADEEKEIDAEKWAARDTLLELLVRDAAGRAYLGAWSRQLLGNPPSLATIGDKKHYYVLRREQGDLLKKEESKTLLKTLLRQLDKNEGAVSSVALAKTLETLDLSPPLLAGIAHVVLDATDACEIARALRGWQALWPDEDSATGAETVEDPASWHLTLRQYFGARDRLVNHNLRIVFSIARKLTAPTVSYADLTQSGFLGLIRAAEKFDYKAGHRFSTYAYNWINQSARRFLEDHRAIVRLPADITAKVNRLYRERLAHVSSTGQKPSAQQLADHMDTEVDVVRRLQHVGNLSVSLDSTYEDDPVGPVLGDKISGWVYPAPTQRAEQSSLHHCLMSGLEVLTKQEQYVVTLRWGLADSPPLSRREMAAQLDVTAERIRQLEASALGKLRNDQGVLEAFRDYCD